MILEGFEIENWSCIRRVAAEALPATGVVVLHGPNGTGKSSIVAALRACLMDFPSNSNAKDLKRWFSKNGNDKPRVTVTFRAQGNAWRITKLFGTKETKLERRAATGTWTTVQNTAADAHQQLRALLGDKDSNKGLHQLLWLTQAEFRLPGPKEFDADVQAQLRAVLGVLQTPLDDRFSAIVKKAWCGWFDSRGKRGEKPKLKKNCSLDKAQTTLSEARAALQQLEEYARKFERMTARSNDLDVLRRSLRRQLSEKTKACDDLQREFERAAGRLEAYQHALTRVELAETDQKKQLERRSQRQEAEKRLSDAEEEMNNATREAEDSVRRLRASEEQLLGLRRELQDVRDAGRKLQASLNLLNERRQLLTLMVQVRAAREKLQQVEGAAKALEVLKKEGRERPAPDADTLRSLEENRSEANRLAAELNAAAIELIFSIEAGATGTRLAVDEEPPETLNSAAGRTPLSRAVRRRAEVEIPGWGQMRITRGSDTATIAETEAKLAELDRSYREGVAAFGISGTDEGALDQLRTRIAERNLRDQEIARLAADMKRIAPEGIDSLRREVAALEERQRTKALTLQLPTATSVAQDDAVDLERQAQQLSKDIEANQIEATSRETEIRNLEQKIDGAHEETLRKRELAAKTRVATATATVDAIRQEVARMDSSQAIAAAVAQAEQTLGEAQRKLEESKLTTDEETVRERLDCANEALRGLDAQLKAADNEYHEIKGALQTAEGLHQRRAEAAARVEALQRAVEREALESDAYHRLYTLFEECREKQLGTVMGPIHDRVLRWMKLLRIGDYQSIRFNDQFLPAELIGAAQLPLEEESTGTIEQVGLMVRLALGATLSTPAEPVVAMLDDPLTHSDIWRLDRMRAVLRSAATGEPSASPPAGPLQIIVLTCHPEWFNIDGARMIDLSRPDVLLRNC